MILPLLSSALSPAALSLTAFPFRVVLDTRVVTRLFLRTYLLTCELRILFLAQGFKGLLNIDLVLHIALNIPRFIGLRDHHLHADWRDVHGAVSFSTECL